MADKMSPHAAVVARNWLLQWLRAPSDDRGSVSMCRPPRQHAGPIGGKWPKLAILALLALPSLPNTAFAQTETFSAAVTNQQGSRFTLSILKTGNRLSFSMTAVGGAQLVEGVPVCERADLQPDGTFSTYCGRFSMVGSSVRLSGNLTEAKLDPIAHLGGATFKLAPSR